MFKTNYLTCSVGKEKKSINFNANCTRKMTIVPINAQSEKKKRTLLLILVQIIAEK